MVTKKDSNRRVGRHIRIRSKISGTAERPRTAVYRSNANISARIIDDVKGVTPGRRLPPTAPALPPTAATRRQPARSASSLPRRRSHRVSPKSFFRQRRLSLSRTCIGVG